MGHLYTLAVSSEIRAELADVLNRPKLRSRFPTITDAAVERTLAVLDGGQPTKLDSVPPVSRNPKDDIFLATALISVAQYLVSEDKDLLVLNPYQNIHILDALEFLQVLQTPSADAKDLPKQPDS